MQNGPIETSKTILHRWMHPESGYTHFSTWRCKKQQECIQQCGLSYHPYRNKDSRIDVLVKLCDSELPVNAASVTRELERRQIDASSARSAQQKAALLLEKMYLYQGMNGAAAPAVTDTVQVQRLVKSSSAEDLATQGRDQVELLMFQAEDKCTETMEEIWSPRRKVSKP